MKIFSKPYFALRNHHEGTLLYHTFNIAWWKRQVISGGGEGEEEATLAFLLTLMDFLEDRSGISFMEVCCQDEQRREHPDPLPGGGAQVPGAIYRVFF